MVTIDLRKSWKTVAVIAVLVAEAAVLGFFVFGSQGPAVEGVVIRPGAASIEVADQTGDWGTLVVERVVTPVPSWVVVQARAGAAGGLGSVLGYTRVPAGTSADVSVALDPKQALINTFVVSLLADSGYSGVFEYSPPATGGGGGGMMGGGSAPAQGDAASAATTPTIDKPLVSNGKAVSLVVIETFRNGAPGVVTRSARP